MVVLKADQKEGVDEDAIKAFCMSYVENGTIPKYGVPNTVLIVDAIPKTSVGKINKKEIRNEVG
jgi:fatty-acyl-CoA synthase